MLSSEEWINTFYSAPEKKEVDVMRQFDWFMKNAFSRNEHRGKLDALKLIYAISPERFSVSPLHGDDNHFSVRVDYLVGQHEVFHFFIHPELLQISHVTFIGKIGGIHHTIIMWRKENM
jgi:hypothetical protein